MRLFFWGSRALTDKEAKTWLAGAQVDHSIYNPVQPIYVANPIIEEGLDPIPIRSGIFSGNRDTVEVPSEIIGPSDPRAEPGTEPRADIADITAALEAIPNQDLSWERWNRTGMATWGASGGSEEGYAAFERWSRKSQKFNEDNTRARWEDYGKYPPCKLGFGTLVHMAREAQPGWRIPSRGVSLDDFYAYMPMHNYIFAPARETWPAASINARLPQVFVGVDREGKPKYIPASKWLDRHKPVEQMTWAPGSPMIIGNRLISNGGWIERAKVSCFNLYVPPNIEPGDASKAQPWLDHIGKIYPDHAEHTIKWLAHRVQRPEEKTNHALVLGGGQGIGKDTLLEPVKRAVGPWNFHEVSPQQIVGRFNGFLKSVILRINEARDLGDIDRFKFYDHMKAYTAAPPDVLRVDEKNLREHYVVNCCAVIITTNYKTNGIYLPADDRRHYVAWSDLVKEDFSKTYWDDLWRWYDTGGCRHVAAYLAGLDLSSFDAKAPPPKTQTFWEIVDASRAPEDAELSDVLDKLEWPKTVTIAQIADKAESDFYDWLRDRKNFRRIPHRMEACGYVAVRNDGAGDGLWKVDGKRQVIYAKAELSLADRLDCATKRAATK